ncbi:hypothetical protein L6164_002699 [Bauhinia variegata]|uniref:Uncharacterized protein n=1 Tax=Bauhinia variegata TaxID=167791 RepID=A0ACB9PZ02_BAUVA|nr:hypothetical protein L6164_002699 [Bauhinia variegata]
MQDCDINFDGEIDREEFVRFMKLMTAETFTVVSHELVLTLVVAPTFALATKRATESVPGVGKVVQRIPNSVYASMVTFAAVLFQKLAQE